MGFEPDQGYAWVVCGASFFYQMVRGGLVYGAGMLFIMFKDSLDAHDSELALITSIHYSISFLVGPFVGILVEKVGDRKVAVSGIVLAAVGLALSCTATQTYHLYIYYGVLNGIGIGVSYNPSLTIISKYFKQRKRLAFGLVACGSGIGSFLFPPLISVLERTYGWKGSLLMLAGINVQAVVVCALFRPVPKKHLAAILSLEEEKTQEQKENEANNEKSNDDAKSDAFKNNDTKGISKYRALYKNPDFFCIAFHAMFATFSSSLVYTHLGNYILSLGYQGSDVTILYSVMGAMVTASRLLSGALSDFFNLSSTVFACGAALINGVFTCAFPHMTQLYLVYIYGVLFAVLISPFNALGVPMINETVPDSLMPTAWGIVCMFHVPGVIFGAPLAAYIYESTNIYAYSFYLAGIIFLLAHIVLIPTQKPFKSFVSKLSLCAKTQSKDYALTTKA